jgi:hypothetical protein
MSVVGASKALDRPSRDGTSEVVDGKDDAVADGVGAPSGSRRAAPPAQLASMAWFRSWVVTTTRW